MTQLSAQLVEERQPVGPLVVPEVRYPSDLPVLGDGAVDRNGLPVIDVTRLKVPGLGRVEQLDQEPFAKVYDPDDNEVRLLTLALTAMVGKSESTYFTYAKAVLRLCQFLWCIGSSPEAMTRREYKTYRRWLAHCNRLPETQKPPRPRDPARLVDVTGFLSADTVEQAEAAARSLYRALEEDDLIEVSPVPASAGSQALKGMNPLDAPRRFTMGPQQPGTVKGIARKKKVNRSPLTADQQALLLSDPTPRGAALWRFMTESGPRVNEVLSLTPERVFLDENYVEVLGKGMHGSTRWVPISDATVEAIATYQNHLNRLGLELEHGVPIWRSLRRPYGPVEYRAVLSRMDSFLGATAGPRRTPHSLRHTAATTMLVDLGMQVEDVQKILGHTHLRSTQVYLHADLATATRSFTTAWRQGRTRPSLDISDLYDPTLITDFLETLDD